MTIDDPWPLLLAVAVGVLAVARVTRFVVDDDYPPMLKLKTWYVERASVQWVPLAECPFCVAPYVALPATLWFASLLAWPGADWNLWLWWIVNGWAAVAYAASMIVVRDVPSAERE